MSQRHLDFGGERTPRREPAPRRVFSVSALTDRIQGLLETELFDVWVEGEISNLRLADSGHWYFSLKDERSQIQAVVWRTAARRLRFEPRDGARVLVRGGLRLYPARGQYQIAVEVIEPLGKGALQQAFEDLKQKLAGEGLFAAERKRPLPALPRRIGVVTSPDGAALRDFLKVLSRRFSGLHVVVYPARVQGDDAAGEIALGVRALDRLGLDVLVVTRGGGSLEDLMAFNEEGVARAIAAARTPVVSAVGHETDHTIADFAADLRAPTPSAAAERVIRPRADLSDRVAGLDRRLDSSLRLRLTRWRSRVEAVTSHRVFAAERGRIESRAQRVAELRGRADRGLERRAERARSALARHRERLEAFRWDRQVAARRERILTLTERLRERATRDLERRRDALASGVARLEGLSPLAVLSRGYALVWDAEGRRLVRRASDVERGAELRVRLHSGALRVTVTEREETT
jgi:exodeoxyribonuclease VII large subunit